MRRALSWRGMGWQLVLLVLVYMVVQAWQQREWSGRVAPRLEARFLDGGAFSLAQNRDRPLLVVFWATWCPVCRWELDGIAAVAEDWPVVSIATQSGDAAELRRFMRERSLDFPVLVDADGEVAGRFGVRGVPTALVIDASGRIRFASVGYSTALGLRFRLWWARWFPALGSSTTARGTGTLLSGTGFSDWGIIG